MGIKLEMRKWCIYFINLIVAFSFGFAVYVFHRIGKPFIRGFYCDDESIGKPYKESTISSFICAVTIAFIEFACVCVGEFIQITDKRKICRGKEHFKKWFVNVVFLVLLFLIGAGSTMFITDIGKYTIGRHRPHFIDVCQPDWAKINCTDIYGRKEYIDGDKFCKTHDKIKLKKSRLSFPSGHSSFTAFAATFLILYIQHRIICKKWGCMPKFFVQAIFGSAAFYVGLSRVSDNKHHPTDVLVGIIIGIVIGVVLDGIVRKYYCRRKKICALPEGGCQRNPDSIDML